MFQGTNREIISCRMSIREGLQTGWSYVWYSLPISDSRWQDCDAYFIPTLTQVAKWLRYEKHLSIEPYRTASGYLYFIAHAESGRDLAHVWEGGDDVFSGNFTTYEKALSHAIDTALDMLDLVNGNNKK